MKKLVVTLIATGVLSVVNGAVVGFGLPESAKNSVYLPNNSWVIDKLQGKFAARPGYNPVESWKDNVMVTYECVDSGTPEEAGDISAIFKKTKTVGLSVPMEDEPFVGPMASSVEVKFKEAIVNIRAKMVETTAQPAESCDLELLNLGSDGAYKKEMEKMALEEVTVPASEFTFDNETKVYSAGMDTYTWGYILEDKDGKRLFWCCHEVGEFKEGKFRKLADVLEGYKKFEKIRRDLQNSGYHGVRWI